MVSTPSRSGLGERNILGEATSRAPQDPVPGRGTWCVVLGYTPPDTRQGHRRAGVLSPNLSRSPTRAAGTAGTAEDPLSGLSSAIIALPRHRPGRQRTSGRTAAERRTRHTEEVTCTINITKSNLPKWDQLRKLKGSGSDGCLVRALPCRYRKEAKAPRVFPRCVCTNTRRGAFVFVFYSHLEQV